MHQAERADQNEGQVGRRTFQKFGMPHEVSADQRSHGKFALRDAVEPAKARRQRNRGKAEQELKRGGPAIAAGMLIFAT